MIKSSTLMPIPKTVNQHFFKTWTSKMAYVLGFFAADGNMIEHRNGECYIEFFGTDREIIEGIKRLLGSGHKVSARNRSKVNPKWKDAYRLQIGSKVIFGDLLKLGMTPNKSNTIKMPRVPKEYLGDFTRGYFDGDGHVSPCTYQRKNRKTRAHIIITGFTSGSKIFLKEFLARLKGAKIVIGGSLYETKGHHLCFSIRDSLRLYNFMYKNSGLYLERKKSIFRHYFKILGP